MNKIISTALLLSLSFSVFAAKEIRNSEMESMKVKTGDITIEIKDGTLDEAVSLLSKKADEKGASYFHIISISKPGMGGTVRATAETYK
ncbi:DUF1471 domain-containing protein [Rahnella ecdela]|uniref:DUF1471 domain-containing protein n=1 Tax=Rahnella ecdela TaxID=2816250 RepID=A0ABS6LAP8_9GAMM|nr:DUF1471 domain-containing protein [Rahnella ecdela]MBU9843905.1 DUF1471 domain-containing protein [Rahnella ecdela]